MKPFEIEGARGFIIDGKLNCRLAGDLAGRKASGPLGGNSRYLGYPGCLPIPRPFFGDIHFQAG
jgi:hypothetical protein